MKVVILSDFLFHVPYFSVSIAAFADGKNGV